MTVKLGIDYSFWRANPTVVKDTGYVAVGRYLSDDPSKNLSASELAGILAAGLDYWLVWETTADRMLGGQSAGQADSKAATEQARQLGLPAGRPIYYAADFDATAAQYPAILAYLAACEGPTYSAGLYGGYNLLTAAHNAGYKYLWQCASAYPTTDVNPYATIYQRQKPTLGLVGSYDENVLLTADYGQAEYAAPITNGGTSMNPGVIYVRESTTGTVAVVDLFTFTKRVLKDENTDPTQEWLIIRNTVSPITVTSSQLAGIPNG